MQVIRQDMSKLLKPSYDGTPPSTTNYVPLSVFDKISSNSHVALIYVYRPPTPSNFVIALGLQKALSVYREFAGRFGKDDKGNPVILLNDEGVRFVEASVDTKLDPVMIYKPSPFLLKFHPGLKGVTELVQVQLTRFTCGSLVVGFTSNHVVADGNATSNFLMAWGQACRGLEIWPLPFHDRTIFPPRDPPVFEFQHKGLEFINKNVERYDDPVVTNSLIDDIVIEKVHFTVEFLSKLKAKACSMIGANSKPYSTFVSLVAHLWRSITKARALNSYETTQLRISVNGRMRLNPKVTNDYFGNLVLWAFPQAKVKDLLSKPISYAAELIHEAVTKVNNTYFNSFIDFAYYKAEAEGLIPTEEVDEPFLCPNLEVESWLRVPFHEMDLGGGRPYMFMPSYFPIEGQVYVLPSFIGDDGSIDAIVPLFTDNLALFKQVCYSLD